jgi:RNA polymerase sigma-70 factor, ECF subfamily
VTTNHGRYDSNATQRLARFEALYDAHRRPAFGLALSILRDRVEAEDTLQEAFLSAWRAGIPMAPESPAARAWILRIVRNRAIDVYRRRSRRAEVPVAEEMDFDAGVPDVSQQAAHSIDAATVAHCLASLPSEQREVMELAYFSGLTHTEIAARANVPLGTVKGRIRLALDRLRTMLRGTEDPSLSA